MLENAGDDTIYKTFGKFAFWTRMSNATKELVLGIAFYAFILLGIGGIIWGIRQAGLSQKTMSELQMLLVFSAGLLAMFAAFDVEVIIEKDTKELKTTSLNKPSSKFALLAAIIMAAIFAATEYII